MILMKNVIPPIFYFFGIVYTFNSLSTINRKVEKAEQIFIMAVNLQHFKSAVVSTSV